MKVYKVIFGFFIALILCLGAARPESCQTETLAMVTYTPPTGWSKTVKPGAIVYTDANQAKNAFCLLTVYAGKPSAGSPARDFANDWNEFVVKPFNADPGPKTQTQPAPDGWQAVVGGASIELAGGVKAAAILTVFSGFNKTASVLAIFNDESYSNQASALIDSIKLDKTQAKTFAPAQSANGLTIRDPFPPRPEYPEKPLAGPLKESITMADLVGEWNTGGGIATSYVNSATGNYAGTETLISLAAFTIKADGTFDMRTTSRASNQTIREASSGTVTLTNDGYIILRTTSGDGRGTLKKYQFIAYMVLPNGGAVVSLIHVGYDLDAVGFSLDVLAGGKCSHPNGFITCGITGEEWSRKPSR